MSGSGGEDFETFWRSHQLAVAVARAALGYLYGDTLDEFEREIRDIYDSHIGVLPDLPRKPRPSLRLVVGD
jgi:hypothetical protein